MTGEQRGAKWERGEGRGGQANNRRNNDSEFVDLELSTKEKAALKEWGLDPIDLDAEFEGLLADGTKVTFREDARNRCMVAFAFAGESSPNIGYILTGRGASVSRALRQLLYKHSVLLQGDWPGYHNRPGATDGDDW